MSATGVAMSLENAKMIAEKFIARFYQGHVGGAIVAGSIRRQKETVGDIELLVPASLPEKDDFFASLAPFVEGAGGLFGKPPIFRSVKGFRPGFKYAQLEAIYEGGGYKIDIFRYWPDQLGILLLIRTGPEGPWRVHYLDALRRAGFHSDEGYLRDVHQTIVPTPDEQTVFRLMGMAFVPPERRK